MKFHSKNTALLVIDMQNDFIKENALLEVKSIHNRLKWFKQFIDNCREKGVKIIFTRHIFSPKNNPVEARLFPEMKHTGLRKGSKGFQIDKTLNPQSKDLIIDKIRYDAFFKTNLEETLRKNKITDLIITGTLTEVCSESTARSAMFRDFNVWFLSDLNFTRDKKIQNRTLKTIATHFGNVISSTKLLKLLKNG